MNPQNDRNADDAVMDYRMILPLREKRERACRKHLNPTPSVASVSALPLAASPSSCSGRLEHRRNHYGWSSSAGKAIPEYGDGFDLVGKQTFHAP